MKDVNIVLYEMTYATKAKPGEHVFGSILHHEGDSIPLFVA